MKYLLIIALAALTIYNFREPLKELFSKPPLSEWISYFTSAKDKKV